jgi:hypothetical protein
MTALPITPGPWFVREHRTALGINGGAANLNIATVSLNYNRGNRYAEKRANARAIAAVPAMVEALLSAYDICDDAMKGCAAIGAHPGGGGTEQRSRGVRRLGRALAGASLSILDRQRHGDGERRGHANSPARSGGVSIAEHWVRRAVIASERQAAALERLANVAETVSAGLYSGDPMLDFAGRPWPRQEPGDVK